MSPARAPADVAVGDELPRFDLDVTATVIVAGATSMKTEVLPIAIFLKWQSIEIEKGMAVTLLLIALSLAALLTFKRLALRRGPGVI